MAAAALSVLLLCAFLNACFAAATPRSNRQRAIAIAGSYVLSAIAGAAAMAFYAA